MEKRAYIDPDWTPTNQLDEKDKSEEEQIISLDNDMTKQASEEVSKHLKVKKASQS